MQSDMIPSFTKEQLTKIRQFNVERRLLPIPTVLVVEDQSFSRSLMEGMLRRNYICSSAANAEEAIALYGEHPPCVTFLDIELPDMNGHDLAAFLKKHDPESFIVMVTANNFEKDVMQACTNNVQGFVAKPFSKSKITQYIDKYLQTRPSMRKEAL